MSLWLIIETLLEVDSYSRESAIGDLCFNSLSLPFLKAVLKSALLGYIRVEIVVEREMKEEGKRRSLLDCSEQCLLGAFSIHCLYHNILVLQIWNQLYLVVAQPTLNFVSVVVICI